MPLLHRIGYVTYGWLAAVGSFFICSWTGLFCVSLLTFRFGLSVWLDKSPEKEVVVDSSHSHLFLEVPISWPH